MRDNVIYYVLGDTLYLCNYQVDNGPLNHFCSLFASDGGENTSVDGRDAVLFRCPVDCLCLFETDAFGRAVERLGSSLFPLRDDCTKQDSGQEVRLFIDSDGVLAKWEDATLEELFSKGFFRSRKPEHAIIQASEEVVSRNLASVYVLTKVVSSMAEMEKREWYAEHTPFIPPERLIFVPYEGQKTGFIENPRKTDILLDDFTPNLLEWHGVGVKFKNGINGTHGRWKGLCVDGTASCGSIFRELSTIIGLVSGKEHS